jgi:hypothetical protein
VRVRDVSLSEERNLKQNVADLTARLTVSEQKLKEYDDKAAETGTVEASTRIRELSNELSSIKYLNSIYFVLFVF